MLKEVGMESVHSQNDHHPDTEARTERIATVSDSELEEPGTASPEPNGQRCREEHTSKRVEQLSVESVNDTGQQESSVGSDRVLNSVDCGSSLFKTIDSKDTSGQPDHSMASKGSNASGGISMESGASTDGPQNPPLHKDTADVLEHTERPHDLSGQQLNTISLKEVCHQEDKATGVKEVCKQPGYSPESKEIHDQTDNASKSTETSHQPKNTKEIDTINDPQNMAREHEETANQPHNTIEREESADQAHNTTETEDTIDQPHNTMEREDTTDQPHNTTETEDTFDQLHNTTEMDETTDQPHNTTEGEQTTDQPHNTTERDETADQQHITTERKETADQPQKTTKREETADQPHNSTEREETADLPHNTMEREKTADQADHVLRSMKNTNKAHNTSTRVCDQAENTTKSVISDYSDTFNGQANSTGGSIEVCEERSCASNTSVHEQPNNSMRIKEMGDQQPNAREYAKISDLLQTTIERGEISDEPLCMMELNEMNEQPEKSTSSEENHVQPHSVTNCETIYNQVLKSTESKGVIDNPEQSAEVNEIGDQTHTITESKGIDNQAGTNEESKEPSDKVYHTTESEDSNYPDRTTMSNGISTQSANITEPKDIRYKPENTMETIEVSVRSVTGRQMAKKIDQPENIPDSEENGDKPDHLMGPKRISEESEKAEMSFEIGDHSADTAMSPEIGNQGDDSSEAGENSDQSVKVAETKDTIEQSEKGILSMEISDQTKNILKCEDHSDQSPDNIESKVINNQSDDPGRSEGISEEPGIIMDSSERSHEAGTTNGTGNSDRLANTVEAFGSNSEAITIVNSAESIDQSNRTNDPLSVRLDDPIYNVSSKDLNIVSCTEVKSNESCQGSPNNTLNRGSRDICHIDAPSRLEYDGFPKHADPLESTDPEILGAQVPGLTNAGTISSHNIEMNESRASTHYSNGPPEAHDQPDTTREEAETKDKPNKSLDHQGPHIVHDHNPEDESNIQHPTGFMDAQHSTAASPPQAESTHEPYRRGSEVQTALDSEIERQLACLLESNMRNTPQSNPRGTSPEETLPAACVGFKGKEGDPLGQDDETTYLYERKNDRSMSSTEASATQDATLAHCVTGTPSSELWEIPSPCLPPDEQFVEDDSKAPSTGASPPSNSHHTDLDPEACSGSVGLDTVRCQIEWTQHPEATPEISSLSIPSALLLQSNRPSGVAEEAVLFEDVRTMDCTSSFHLSDVDYSMWASDGQRDVAFQPYGEDDTVSPSLQVGHVCDATESKAPAKGDQCENKLQKDISQTPKSPNPEHFSRPEPDLEVVPTKRDISEQEGSIPGSEHPPFTSDTNDEEPAYDTLLVERYMYAEDVPDGNPTLVNPSASEDELTLQRASHEHAFTEGLQAPVCLRAPQAETDSSLNLNLGDVFPLDSGTDPDLPYEGLISKSWPIDPVVGGFNEVEETNSGRYVGEGHREAHEVPVRIHPYGFKVDFTKFHSLVPPPLQGADEEVHKPPAASNPDLDKAGYEVLAAAEVVHHLPLGEDSNVDTSSGWESDLSITDTSSSPIKSQMPRPLHFYNLFKWHEHSRPSRSFSEEVTVEPQDVHAGLWSPVNPRVLLNSLPVTLPNDGSVLGAETSPIPDLSPASENVFLSPQVKFAPVTVIAGTAEPKTQSNWVPTWKVPDDSVLQALTRKIGSPKLGRRTCKVYRTRGGSDAGEIRHRQSTPFLISHIGLPEEKVPAETTVREPDRLPSLTTKVFKISPKPAPTKAFFKQAAVSEDAGPNAEEGLPSAAQGTFEAALPAQGMDNSTSDPVQLRKRHDPFTSSNIVRRHSKLINSSRQLYQEYSDEALNQAIERQKRGETFLEEPEPSSPRLRRKLMSTPDSYLQRLSVSSSAALWQDIPMIRGTSALLSMTREEQKLQEAKFELIMSEASYLRSLNIAVDHFQHSPELQTLLSNQERQWLFSRLQEVRDVSSNFLYDLEEKFEDNMYTFNVCDVVLSHAADFRKVYLPYVTNQSYQDQTFQRLLSGNPRFQQVLAKLESDPVCQRLSLKSFLILPFQRITRLKLLVQNILKRTRPGSREEAPATQAYSLLEQLIKDCNENVQRMRSTEELIYLSQKIEFECKIFPLISQSRRLVKQGELLELESSTPLSFKWKVITRPIYLHLFNDCLLLSRRREGAKFLVFDHARVSKVQGEKCEMKMHGNSKNIFRLILQENNQGRKVEFLLRTETQSEKLRWIAALAHHKKKPDFLQCHDNPQVQCLKSYKAREHDELSLEKADVLMVAQQSKDGWMEGTRLSDGEHGWFPVENVEDISNKHVRLRNLKEEQRVQHARAKLIPPHHQR